MYISKSYPFFKDGSSIYFFVMLSLTVCGFLSNKS